MRKQRETSTLVDYTYNLTTDVNEYAFLEGSRQAVDEWDELLHHAYRHAS